MGRGNRRAAALCAATFVAAATMVGAPPSGAYPSLPVDAQATPERPTFVEALSAIPDATDSLAKARQAVAPARERAKQAQAAERVAHERVAAAGDLVRDSVHARTRAEIAAARTQAAIEAAARAMYASGGSVPSLATVLLTADSSTGLTRSLQTREHLARAASAVLADRVRAERMAVGVDVAATRARAAFDAVASEAQQASRSASAAARALVDSQRLVDTEREHLRRLMRITRADRSAEYGTVRKCGDWVTKLLSRSGFSGEDLREAWAIVMRESGGREDAISVSNDLGLFQINTTTWKTQPWFDRKALLTRGYNAKIGYLISRGGKSWYSWGLDGHGRPDPRAYVKAGWTPEHIRHSIVLPYIAWYQQYPCRPSYESDYPFPLPTPRSEEDPSRLNEFQGDGYNPTA